MVSTPKLLLRVGHFRHWSHSMAIVTLNKIDKFEHGIMVYYILTKAVEELGTI